jgi:predicted nucleic acid-binding protein
VPRAVFDPNVLIAALISPIGAPAALFLALTRGRFELIVSAHLLAELERPREFLERLEEVQPPTA